MSAPRPVLSRLPTGQSPSNVTARTRVNTGDSTRAGDRQSPAFARLLTLRDVAEHCACSYWTVRAWVDAGTLPVLRLPGRLIRVRAEDLETFLKECAP